jgi:Tol biopolymer transport system component
VTRPARRPFVALLAAVLAACAGSPIAPERLPEAPIAFVYRSLEEALEIADLLSQEEEAQAGRPGVARLDAIERWLSPREVAARAAAAQRGRLSLLEPRSGLRTDVESAPRGAVPLDWSPDGQKLLFASDLAGSVQIHEWNRATGEVARVTRGPAAHPFGSYGPDGRLAFSEVVAQGGRAVSRVWLAGAGGSDPRPATEGPFDIDPQWSPDGRTLVYVSEDPVQGPRILTVDLAGDPTPRVIARGRDPVFTADGRFVLFASKPKEHWQLYRMLPDGSGKAPIGQSAADDLRPGVSPDGAFVVFVRHEEHRDSLHLRRMDGSAERPLLGGGEGDGAFPRW